MPLPPPDPDRELLHLRRIDVQGFLRRDGRYEIEASLTDTKTRPLSLARPDGTLHLMRIRLVFDDDMTVHDVVAVTEAAPYEACPDAAPALRSLVGLRLDTGWTRAVRERLGGARGCTHLVELLGPVATTAFQTTAPLRMSRPDRLDAGGRPVKIDSCFAYARDGEVVRERWPAFHEPRAQGDAVREADRGAARADGPGTDRRDGRDG